MIRLPLLFVCPGADAVSRDALTLALEGCALLGWGGEGKGGALQAAAAAQQLEAVNSLLHACEEAVQVRPSSQVPPPCLSMHECKVEI